MKPFALPAVVASLAFLPALPLLAESEKKPEGHAGPHGEAMKEKIEAKHREFQAHMQEKMQGAMREAAELEAKGRKDEAEALRAKARERMEAAIKEHRMEMQKHHQEMMRDKPGHPGGPPPEAVARLKHIEQALGHLKAAGLHDVAEQVGRAADRMRAAIRGEHAPDEGRPQRPEPPHGGEVEALRRELKELREAVGQLREEKKHKEKGDEKARKEARKEDRKKDTDGGEEKKRD